LGAEAPEPDVMQRKPRDRHERLLNRRTLSKAYLFLGPIQAAAAMSAFYFMYLINGWRPGMEMAATGLVYVLATTMTHNAIVTTQIGNGFAQRTNMESIFKVGFFSNRLLLWGILAECVAVVALTYVPFLQNVFNMGPLGPIDWAFLIALIPTLLIADEIRKYFVRRKLRRQVQSGILAS
jgi:magnesium-transporting ATPase (P-type)